MTTKTTTAALIEIKSILAREIENLARKEHRPTTPTANAIDVGSDDEIRAEVAKLLKSLTFFMELALELFGVWTAP